MIDGGIEQPVDRALSDASTSASDVEAGVESPRRLRAAAAAPESRRSQPCCCPATVRNRASQVAMTPDRPPRGRGADGSGLCRRSAGRADRARCCWMSGSIAASSWCPPIRSATFTGQAFVGRHIVHPVARSVNIGRNRCDRRARRGSTEPSGCGGGIGRRTTQYVPVRMSWSRWCPREGRARAIFAIALDRSGDVHARPLRFVGRLREPPWPRLYRSLVLMKSRALPVPGRPARGRRSARPPRSRLGAPRSAGCTARAHAGRACRSRVGDRMSRRPRRWTPRGGRRTTAASRSRRAPRRPASRATGGCTEALRVGEADGRTVERDRPVLAIQAEQAVRDGGRRSALEVVGARAAERVTERNRCDDGPASTQHADRDRNPPREPDGGRDDPDDDRRHVDQRSPEHALRSSPPPGGRPSRSWSRRRVVRRCRETLASSA